MEEAALCDDGNRNHNNHAMSITTMTASSSLDSRLLSAATQDKAPSPAARDVASPSALAASETAAAAAAAKAAAGVGSPSLTVQRELKQLPSQPQQSPQPPPPQRDPEDLDKSAVKTAAAATTTTTTTTTTTRGQHEAAAQQQQPQAPTPPAEHELSPSQMPTKSSPARQQQPQQQQQQQQQPKNAISSVYVSSSFPLLPSLFRRAVCSVLFPFLLSASPEANWQPFAVLPTLLPCPQFPSQPQPSLVRGNHTTQAQCASSSFLFPCSLGSPAALSRVPACGAHQVERCLWRWKR
ncbi:hypothetical protein CDD83_3401 [Cordyceps sp. RAO-2017]|nr:hypothetical protein CDD83_3401 [Cordyceps sp. RAO-2017]